MVQGNADIMRVSKFCTKFEKMTWYTKNSVISRVSRILYHCTKFFYNPLYRNFEKIQILLIYLQNSM